jgi:hypothetical protein
MLESLLRKGKSAARKPESLVHHIVVGKDFIEEADEEQ